jgi:hypothetical protein
MVICLAGNKADMASEKRAVSREVSFLNLDLLCLTPLSALFQLYYGNQFQWWKKPEYPERTTDHGHVTGKLHHLWQRVEYTPFCDLQSRE